MRWIIVSFILSIGFAFASRTYSLQPVRPDLFGFPIYAQLAKIEPVDPNVLFGTPEEAYENFIDPELTKLLDEYLGLFVSVTGVLFVIKALGS